MGDVVSLGSINVDKIHHVSDAEITDLRDRYSWFPDLGQTVQIDDLPTDFSVDPDSIRHGGKGANQAVAAAKAGAETEMLGKVGPDAGEFGVRSHLTEAGVGVTQIGTASEPTGTAYVFVGQEGDNWIIVRPGANSAIDSTYIREQYETILSADCLLLQNEIPIEPVMTLLSELATERDRPTIVLDPRLQMESKNSLGAMRSTTSPRTKTSIGRYDPPLESSMASSFANEVPTMSSSKRSDGSL